MTESGQSKALTQLNSVCSNECKLILYDWGREGEQQWISIRMQLDLPQQRRFGVLLLSSTRCQHLQLLAKNASQYNVESYKKEKFYKAVV